MTNEEGKVWDRVMELESKDNRHKGVANTLDIDDLLTIFATAEFFGAGETDLAQLSFDLKRARYRVFDWLAMAVQGRMSCRNAVKVFAHVLIKVDGDVTKFIDDLRYNDYEMDRAWESIFEGAE